MAIKRKVRYEIEVTGAVQAADAIGQVDGAATDAADALNDSGDAAAAAARDYAKAGAAARSLGDRFDGLNDRAAKVGGRFGDVRSRLGEIEDAFMVFSGVAIAEMVGGLTEAAVRLYEWTEAGKAAKVAAEAQAAAVEGVVGKMTALSRVTRVATDDIFRLISAQIAQETASKGLVETTGKILERQTEYAETLRDLARLKEQGLGLDTFNHRMGTAIAGQQTILAQRAKRLHDELAELNAQFEAQKGSLGSATQLIEGLTKTIDKAGAAAPALKAAAAETGQLVQWLNQLDGAVVDVTTHLGALTDTLGQAMREVGDVGRTMEEVGADMAAAFRESRDAAVQLVWDTNQEILAGATAWEGWADYAIGAIDTVAAALRSVSVAMAAIAEREITVRRNAVASAQAQVAAAETAEERAAAEQQVYEAQMALQRAEAEAAEARRAFMVLEFALEGTKMGIKALESAALASFLAALPFGVGAPFVPAAVAAAALYGTAAAAYGVAAVATAVTPTPAGNAPPPPGEDALVDSSTVSAGDRDRDEGGVVVNLNFQGQPFETRNDIHDAMIGGLDAASRRRGRPRADLAGLQRRGR